MPEKRAKQRHDWTFVCSTPPREVFAVTEQMIGTPPYRFQEADDHTACVLQVSRKGFFGNWTGRVRRAHWITVSARLLDTGTEVTVASSGDHAATSRALQVVYLLGRGARDSRTVYRDRRITAGPVTLVASWAGSGYALYSDASRDAARSGPVIHTASELVAMDQRGFFVEVLLPDGRRGWVELDQIVAAPGEATREAQERTAHAGV